MRPIFFGERPGPNTDPERPLFPHTTTGAAAHLIALTGVSTEFYLDHSDRYNVFNDGERELSLEEARLRVKQIMARAMHADYTTKIVWVGKEALRAAPQFYRNMDFLEQRDASLLLPHTSGVNSWYNSPDNRAAASVALRSHLEGWA